MQDEREKRDEGDEGEESELMLSEGTKVTIFREEATSALAGFNGGPLSWSNWNLI